MLALFLSAFFWSTSFPLIKVTLKEVTPIDMLFWRFAFASVLSLPLLLVKGPQRLKEAFRNPGIVVLGSVNALGFFLQFEAQRLTLASKTAFFVNLYVVFVAIADSLMGEKLGRGEKSGIFLALFGALLLSSEGNLQSFREGRALGDLMATGAAVGWSLYILLSKRMVKGLNPPDLVVGVMGWTLIASTPFFLVRFSSLPSPPALLQLIYLGLFCSVVPYLLFTYALKGVSATRSALVLLLEVILAALWSYIFLSERLKCWGFAGGVLILLGLVVGNLRREN